MRRLARLIALGALAALVLPSFAQAGHTTDPRTKNIHPLGHIVEPAVLGGFGGANPDIHTDIAFWASSRFRGTGMASTSETSLGSRESDAGVTDVLRRQPGRRPRLPHHRCALVEHSGWNAGSLRRRQYLRRHASPTRSRALSRFEGLHVFDISDLGDPELVAQIPLACGSHTASAVPDLANDRLLVYSSPSAHSAANPNPPGHVRLVRHRRGATGRSGRCQLPSGRAGRAHCHDVGVILGDVMRAACAGGTGFRVFSLGGAEGGSLEDPEFMHHVDVPTVTVGRSAAFSWDGETIIFGHEPGGSVAAECEATDTVEKKSFFFYETESGDFLGKWTLPRSQLSTENCTLHNYNVVPLRNGRDVLVSGNYQAGTWGRRLHRPRERTDGGVERSSAEAGAARNPVLLRRDGCLVELLVRRVHLRDQHRRGLEHVQAERQHARSEDQARTPEPTRRRSSRCPISELQM
jgi:hypothetical protein